MTEIMHTDAFDMCNIHFGIVLYMAVISHNNIFSSLCVPSLSEVSSYYESHWLREEKREGFLKQHDKPYLPWTLAEETFIYAIVADDFPTISYYYFSIMTVDYYSMVPDIFLSPFLFVF